MSYLCTSFSTFTLGKFIESRTFWLYVLVAEFLVLVFLFDMILYCKKSGIIYNATRKCRNAKVRDMQSAQEGESFALLLSNWVNCSLVNSNFQLDFGSFPLNFSFNFEILN